MSFTFTKLFSGITESTVWVEPYATRVLWVSMLSWADKRGRVFGSVPGIARRAGINVDEAEAALASFLSPDRHSRTKDNDGRRIETIDGGWRLLNYAKYREMRDHEDRLEYQREWDRKHRPERYKNPTLPTNPTEFRPAPTKAEAEADKTPRPRAKRSGIPEGFAITEPTREWARSNGYEPYLEAHLDYFRDYAASSGKTYADWDAAFRNCIKGDWGDVRKKFKPGEGKRFVI